jgi:hypothetical protein
MKTLTLRIEDDDHKLFLAMAEAEDLPTTVLIRRVMKQYARDNGHLAEPGKPQLVQGQPTQEVKPPRTDHPLNNEVLLNELELGESLSSVAQSNNLTVSEVQARVAKAKKARADGTLHREQALQSFIDNNPRPSPEHIIATTTSEGAISHQWKLRAPAQDEQFRTDDNMTMADADKNAEIARQRLLAMGFRA